jgi:hypothetical protein
MNATRQSWIGVSLALAIIAAWLALHVFGIFFMDVGQPLPALLLLAAGRRLYRRARCDAWLALPGQPGRG